MIEIDGSYGEGGGQIIRTSLALSLVTGKAFRVGRVRARRDPPGLKRQHLTAVNAAAEVGRAKAEGARVGSQHFSFEPGEVAAGDYRFRIGTAGSTTLVLQTVLPPLMIASAPSLVTLEGGTHNVHAPPFDFLAKAFLPLVRRTGPKVEIDLVRYGFYPPGGGKLTVLIEPTGERRRLDIPTRGEIRRKSARALCVKLPPSVGERELAVVRERLGWDGDELQVETSDNAFSPGNVLTLEMESDHLTELFTGVGERGVRAEVIAGRAVAEVESYLAHGAPVGEHLADQLLIPLALAGGGSFVTGQPSPHTTTNIEIIKMFLDVEITTEQVSGRQWKIDVTV
ncbi:MAG TPA: RNA 3'-terminal phosphate cyclase [Pyrinomonadaceae bacterium]|jgi:RNA 3'-terminal phosphate cyclase (ATP)|nr:RNA 3'-terminal phosphate cyclase [Pyrinomonadaceae bacterium]